MDLFENNLGFQKGMPLAERVRPQKLDDVVGQSELLAPGKFFRRMVEKDQMSSAIFWGPPGTGKTTLAKVIANTTRRKFEFFSATTQGVKEIREILSRARTERAYQGQGTLVFIDEIHKLNRSQQDVLLEEVEKGTIHLIAATTESPSFEINSALLSRSRVFVLEHLSEEEIKKVLNRALREDEVMRDSGVKVAKAAIDYLAQRSEGDARVALNTLEVAVLVAENGKVSKDCVAEALQSRPVVFDKSGDGHYDVASALQKSIRSSDVDASIYWLARAIAGGENVMFLARRLVVIAAEDVGLADPRALQVAIAAQQAAHLTGLPEARIPLAEATIYLAAAPKSNSAYMAIKTALAEVSESGSLPVPKQIRNAPTKLHAAQGFHDGYQYAHDYPHGIPPLECLPTKIKNKRFYAPKETGMEKNISERLDFIKERKDEQRKKNG